MVSLKSVRVLLTLTTAVVSFMCGPVVFAADPTAPAATPPTVVPQDRNDHNVQRDLHGVPDNVKNLITTFDQNRDKY